MAHSCRVHCPEGGGGILTAAVMAVAAAAAVWVLWQVAVVLAACAMAFLAVVAVGAWASRRLAWRLSVVYWPSQQAVEREAINHTVIRAELAAPRKQIEAPARVLEGVIISKEEAVR